MKNKVIYVLLMVVLSLLLTGAALIDSKGIVDIVTKVCIIVGILIYAKKRGELKSAFSGKVSTKYLLIAIIPVVFNLLQGARAFNTVPLLTTAIVSILGVLTTAVWEELFYRYVGENVINKEYSKSNVIFLSITFSLAHAVNYFFYDAFSVTLQLVLAFCVALFMLGLYKKTGNILVTIVAHFLINMSSQIYTLFSTSRDVIFGGVVQLIILCVEIIVMAVIGTLLLKDKEQKEA